MKPSFTRLFQTAESDVPHARDTATFPKARLGCAESGRTYGKLNLLVYGKVITGRVDPDREEASCPLHARVENILDSNDRV